MRIFAAAAAALFATIGVSAQTQNGAAEDRPPLGSTITVDALANLPSSQSLSSLIDVSIPEVVGDRIDSGGLSTGETGRLIQDKRFVGKESELADSAVRFQVCLPMPQVNALRRSAVRRALRSPAQR